MSEKTICYLAATKGHLRAKLYPPALGAVRGVHRSRSLEEIHLEQFPTRAPNKREEFIVERASLGPPPNAKGIEKEVFPAGLRNLP